MKLLLAALVLLSANSVHATCAFGEDSTSYENTLGRSGEKLIRLSERISFFRRERIGGLQDVELNSIYNYIRSVSQDVSGVEEAAQIFMSNDGYLTYLSGSSEMGYLQYLIIAAYPGDNEYGAIYRVDDSGNAAEKVADIADGEISNCVVQVPNAL